MTGYPFSLKATRIRFRSEDPTNRLVGPDNTIDPGVICIGADSILGKTGPSRSLAMRRTGFETARAGGTTSRIETNPKAH